MATSLASEPKTQITLNTANRENEGKKRKQKHNTKILSTKMVLYAGGVAGPSQSDTVWTRNSLAAVALIDIVNSF